MTWYQTALIAAYLSVLLVLSFYGFHRSLLVWLFYRHKQDKPEPKGRFEQADLPVVTVQLPLFNEMYVVERLLEAVVQIDYPKDKLEIQVLDDSTDETQGICRAKVTELQKRGFDIQLHPSRSTASASRLARFGERSRARQGRAGVGLRRGLHPQRRHHPQRMRGLLHR
jgi:cellulose synthase/poly-beta-1,6-N-acetylglucosamine synthase-like glycosyltransferase